jgi:hypothetical protein
LRVKFEIVNLLSNRLFVERRGFLRVE